MRSCVCAFEAVGWVEHLRNPSHFSARKQVDGFRFALPILREHPSHLRQPAALSRGGIFPRLPIRPVRFRKKSEEETRAETSVLTIKGKAYIAGIYEHPTRHAPDKSTAQLHAEVAKGAIEDA